MRSADVPRIIERTLNYVDPRLAGHGAKVSYLVMNVLRHMGKYSQSEIQNTAGLALLHDIGAYKTEEIGNLLFESENVWEHSIYGSLFLRAFSPLDSEIDAVMLHHLPYSQYRLIKNPIADDHLAGLLCIADRMEIYSRRHNADKCRAHLLLNKGAQFSPYWVDAFIAAEDSLGILGNITTDAYRLQLKGLADTLRFTQDEKAAYLSLIAYSIDFRSHFMVLHTVTTVSIAIIIAQLIGLNAEEQRKIRFGALLHDVGKVATPVDILEKPGRLTDEEMTIMRRHVILTKEIISGYVAPDIANIAIRHHEKLDGSGYPLGLSADELNVNERIVAVADVVSALIRKRSYKEAYDKQGTMKIIRAMSEEGKLCPRICTAVLDNFDCIIAKSDANSMVITEKYEQIQSDYKRIMQQIYAY